MSQCTVYHCKSYYQWGYG